MLNCHSFCSDPVFTKTLATFGLKLSDHSLSICPIDSLINALSWSNEVEGCRDTLNRLVKSLNVSDSNIRCLKDLYDQGVKAEFGSLERDAINAKCCSIVGLISVMSKLLDAKIYVVTGFLPLRQFQYHSNVLKFDFGESDNGDKHVIGLVGMNIFHKLSSADINQDCWMKLDRDSFPMRDESGFFSRIAANITTVNNFDSETESSDNENREAPIDPEASSLMLDESTSNSLQMVTNHVSISEFLARYFNRLRPDGTREIFKDEAYYSEEVIDLEVSKTEEIGPNGIENIMQNFDIDGFFALFPWSSKGFTGNATISGGPLFGCKREKKGFDKLILDSGIEFGNNVIFCKFATAILDSVHVDFFYSGSYSLENDIDEITESKIESINSATILAYHYAMNARCYISRNNRPHPDCTTYLSTSSLCKKKRSSKKEILSGKKFTCFCFHFSKKLAECLSTHGIRINSEFCYVQMVGMKSLTESSSFNNMHLKLQDLRSVFNFNVLKCFVDFAITTFAQCVDRSKNVMNLL